jgi:hypothetical protein
MSTKASSETSAVSRITLLLKGVALLVASLLPGVLLAQSLNEKVEAGLGLGVDIAKQIASDPVIVAAVEAQNQQLSAEYANMTQEQWNALSDLDPLVRALIKNASAQVLKNRKTDAVSEAFVSDSQGRKVSYLGKTTNWSHLGKPKHDLPMSGQVWKGKLELDKSSGRRQIQIGVPVLKDGKPIGSLVIGVSLESLTSD